jgi:hypothetical protein
MDNLGIGIMNLTHSDSAEEPSKPLDDAFSNQVVDGVAVRTQWGRVQPSQNQFYGTYLDSAKTLSAQHGKEFSILVVAGVGTPQWVYDQGAYKFPVHEKSGASGYMPLPWDPVFQKCWRKFLESFFKRYGGHSNLAYVAMSGFSRKAESNFVDTPEDIAALDAKAREDGFADGMEAWVTGAKWVIDQYGKLCPSTVTFILVMGSPLPGPDGESEIRKMYE